MRAGTYNVKDGTLNFLDLSPVSGKGFTFSGEGFGTLIYKNNSNSGFAALGNNVAFPANGIIFRDFQMISTNQSFRLLNGQPATIVHKNIFIERILAENNQTSSQRFNDLDANNLHINEVTLDGQLRGGAGDYFFASQNLVRNNASKTAGVGETECLDINGNHIGAFVYANWFENCYEQAVDNGNYFSYFGGNVFIANSPTDQGGFTQASDWGTVIGNIGLNASNDRGVIESHSASDYITYIGNLLLTNDTTPTNMSMGSDGSLFTNSAARCMRLDGRNSTLVGNIFKGCRIPFGGLTGGQNLISDNWFEPTANLSEAYIGNNWLGTIRTYTIQGGNTNITRDLYLGGTNSTLIIQANGTFQACNAGTAGGIYYDGVTATHYGCNSTNWRAMY